MSQLSGLLHALSALGCVLWQGYEDWEQRRTQELEEHAQENLKRHLLAIPAHPPLPGRGPAAAPAQEQQAQDGTQAWVADSNGKGNRGGSGEGRGAGEARVVPSRGDGERDGGEGTAAAEASLVSRSAGADPTASGSDSDAESSRASPGASEREGQGSLALEDAQGIGVRESTQARTDGGPAADAEMELPGGEEEEDGT